MDNELFRQACKVSAKRLFPNFVNIDAPYNLQYYKPGDYNSCVATMGCADGNENISYALVLIITDGNYSHDICIALDGRTESDIETKYIDSVKKAWGFLLSAQ